MKKHPCLFIILFESAGAVSIHTDTQLALILQMCYKTVGVGCLSATGTSTAAKGTADFLDTANFTRRFRLL